MYFKLFLWLSFLRNSQSAASCCDRSRSGYVEFRSLTEHLRKTDVIEQHFNYDNQTDVFFINHDAKILYNSIHYFFDDFYEQHENRTKVCLFKLYRRYDEIEHVVFNDGSRPRQIVFGCHSDEECCEIGCCSISNYSYFYVIYPIGIFLISVASFARRRRLHNAREQHDEEDDAQN